MTTSAPAGLDVILRVGRSTATGGAAASAGFAASPLSPSAGFAASVLAVSAPPFASSPAGFFSAAPSAGFSVETAVALAARSRRRLGAV